MQTIIITDSGERRDRFTIEIGNKLILASTIGQVCRRIRALCPELPKRSKVPIPDAVLEDIVQRDAEARIDAAMEHAKEVMRQKAESRI